MVFRAGGGGPFDPIGVELVVVGQQQYQAALATGLRHTTFFTQRIGEGFVTMRAEAAIAFIAIAALITQLRNTVNSAKDFELQMAQLNQVMGSSKLGLANVTEDVRRLAKELPFTTKEIAAVVTEAARAGIVGRQNLTAFTKAMLDFATISGISADQAAQDFAHLALAFQHPYKDINQLTSSVAALDSNLPTTSKDIVLFTLRIAAAGTAMGLTAGQIFGISAAMTSLGIRAEAGGTAVQRVLFAMTKAVRGAGKDLADFAQVAGVSAREFAALWRDDPAQAFIRFVEGLGIAGDQAQAILKGLEIGDVRLVRAFITTAGAGQLLRTAIEDGAAAMGDADIASRRAAIVYETTANQVKRLENAFHDNVIEVGTALLPAYRDVLTLLNGMAVRGGEFARILSGSVLPQLIATSRVTAGYLSPSLKLSDTFAKDLADSFVRMGIAAQSSLISAASGVQHLAGNLARASNTATFLQQQAEHQQLLRQREAAQANADLPGQRNRERHLAEVTRLNAEITRTTDAMAASVARETDIVNIQNRALANNLYIFQQLEFVRSQATKRSDEDRRIRETFNAIESDTIGVVEAEIAVRQQSIAAYKAERDAIEQETGSTDRLTAKIVLQEGVVAKLIDRLRELKRLGALGRVPDGDRDFSGLDDAADKAKKAKTALQELGVSADQARKFLMSVGATAEQSDLALRRLGADSDELGESVDGMGISMRQAESLMRAAGFTAEQMADRLNRIHLDNLARQIDELTKGLSPSLTDALGLAISSIGDDFTGAVHTAAVATATQLTQALLDQATIIGGPYAEAWRQVAQVIAEATQASLGQATATDKATVSAEKALAALSLGATVLQAMAKVGGDTSGAIGLIQNSLDQLRQSYLALPEAQRVAANATLDGIQKLLDQAQAAGTDAQAIDILLVGIRALVGAQKDAAGTADDEAKKAKDLNDAKKQETAAQDALAKGRERLAKAEAELSRVRRMGGDKRGASNEVRAARADVKAAEDEIEKARRKQDEGKSPLTPHVAILPPVTTITRGIGTEAARLSSAASLSPMDFAYARAPIGGTGLAPSVSRSITVNASYRHQPEETVRHDLEALAMAGYV